MEPFRRRLSSHVCVDFGSPLSETEDWWLCFGVFQQICTVYDSGRLRGWNRFTGGSLVTFASILVRLQAKREVDGYGLASSNKFMLCMILAGCAGVTVLPAALYSPCVDFGSPSSETGGWWFRFDAFQPIYGVYDFRRLRGWNRLTGGSLVTLASILVRLHL